MARIGILTSKDVSERNMEFVLFRIASILAQEHTVELIGPEKTSARLRKAFFIFPRSPGDGFGGLFAWLNPVFGRVGLVRRYVRERKPDVLLAVSGIATNGFTVALAGRLEKVPAIARITSDIFEVYKHNENTRQRWRLFIKNNIVGRLTLRLATRTILLHEAQKDMLAARGYDPARFYAVPQPVVFPEGGGASDEVRLLRKTLGISGDAFVFGYVGRIGTDKRIPFLCDAVEAVLAQDDAAVFISIGAGPMADFMKARLGGHKRVRLLDQLPRDDLASYYRLMDVLLQTSKSEGLSNVLIEALYHGVPVVSTDSGVITRALISNIAGRPADMAARVLARDYVLDRLPEELDVDKNARLWLGLVDSVLKTA